MQETESKIEEEKREPSPRPQMSEKKKKMVAVFHILEIKDEDAQNFKTFITLYAIAKSRQRRVPRKKRVPRKRKIPRKRRVPRWRWNKYFWLYDIRWHTELKIKD
ncbi:uncharacterized protein LOC143266672 isoform X1 [Megachile rotundata]|uniref:uncharacterized protein LOC143266672 isoform X1 n=1 Tax=Megachile rotundata TaxID=143995 RepID=UPI003FD5BE22